LLNLTKKQPNKLYTITADATTSAGGTATVSIYPGLLTEVDSGTTIIHTDVPLYARFKNAQNALSVNQTQFTNLTLELIEVF